MVKTETTPAHCFNRRNNIGFLKRPYSGKWNDGETPFTRQKQRIGPVLRSLIFDFGGAYLLSQTQFPGGIHPAGAAYFLARQPRTLIDNILLLSGVLIGSIAAGGYVYAVLLTASLVPVGLINGLGWFQKPAWLERMITLFCWGCGYYLFNLMWNGANAKSLAVLLEITLGLAFGLLFPLGLHRVERKASPDKNNSKSSLFVFTLILVMALAGSFKLTLFSIGLTDIGAMFLILTAVYLGGEGVGAMMGIAVAAFFGMTAGSLITWVAIYGAAGFLAGALRRFGRIGISCGAALGILFILEQLNFPSLWVKHLLPWGIGMASFIIIPKSSLAPLIPCFSREDVRLNKSEEEQHLKEAFLNRLHDLAGVFAEFAKSFHEAAPVGAGSSRTDLYALIDQVCLKNCQHCHNYQNCWGENFYVTYRELFDLVALAELYGEVKPEHVKGRLAKSCFQQYRLLTTINCLLEKNQADIAWQHKLDESKSFLTNQLQGVAAMIDDLAVEIETDRSFKTEIEEKIRHSFNLIGISAKEVRVMAFGEHQLEIKIKQRSCNRKRECQQLAAPLVGGLLGRDYFVWERHCHPEDGYCSYSLTPSRRYTVRTAVGKIAQTKDNSGDSHLLQEMKDGHFMAILSDGMGHGNAAAVESNTSVAILEKLIQSGLSHDFAVKTVNSVLLLHSPEESFATIDLAFINLYNAKAEFIKIGAAASYVKRGGEVWNIHSTSLPAGIFNTVEPERTTRQLQANDFVIMMTDGISDSMGPSAGKDDWVAKALRQIAVVGPEALAEYLLNMAKNHLNGVIKDDMTVIVLQVEER